MSTQLDLFEGLVLTTEQQERVERFIESNKKETIVRQEDISRTMLLLDEAGFILGRDYVNNFNVEEVTNEREFGYSYNSTNFNHEVTYLHSTGGIRLIVDTIKDNKIIKHNASVSREGDKLMCANITDQYRYYKPSTLFNKLKEYNKNQLSKLESQIKKCNVLEYTIDKYTKLYPEAAVEKGRDYYKTGNGYFEFDIIHITFKSGSTVTLKLGYEQDNETVHKKYDAKELRGLAILNYFNNQ